MKTYYLGIDIGTSAAKLLLATKDGQTVTVKSAYRTNDSAGWCDAVRQGLLQLAQKISLDHICAVSLSSQVGTYITDKGDIIPWSSNAGTQELYRIKEACSRELFVEQIGMAHPDLISYPLPRLLYIQNNFSQATQVIMPKEVVLQQLTDNLVTDTFSQRGLCHPGKNAYAHKLLDMFRIRLALPEILAPTDLAGYVTKAASQTYLLPEGTPVYVGCNDFYAGLLGMGVLQEDTVFELSGTSEHMGVITGEMVDGNVISGKYFNGYATYGGTKSSGVACSFAMENFDAASLPADFCPTDQPIFLPYMNGERAPIYDEKAKGVFFGITGKTTRQDMAYAVLEGVVFSLYHISRTLPVGKPEAIITGGGSAANPLMARLKAELFDARILRVKENDSSALGAAILAMVGHGAFASLEEAVRSVVRYDLAAKPDGSMRGTLLSRFEIYKNLYVALQDSFEAFSKI